MSTKALVELVRKAVGNWRGESSGGGATVQVCNVCGYAGDWRYHYEGCLAVEVGLVQAWIVANLRPKPSLDSLVMFGDVADMTIPASILKDKAYAPGWAPSDMKVHNVPERSKP